MDPITQQAVLAAAGAGGGAKTYVDDVFSTFLYDGNGGTQTITNGIDLAGEGGLVWFKKRNAATYGGLWDTERGVTKRLRPDNSDAESTASNLVTSFNSNGVSISATGGTQINNNNDDYVSWTFRKAPGFFDVVTYTGNGTAGRTVSHNLGSVPGMIVIKCTSAQDDFTVYHRSIGATKNLRLNADDSERTETNKFNDTEPTSTQFTLGFNSLVNGSGQTYVAYIFAHDDAQFGIDGDESIIKCGTYNGSSGTQVINLGFELQWLLIKRSESGDQWRMLDVVREMSTSDARYLNANTVHGEGNYGSAWVSASSTGFTLYGSDGSTNRSGGTYIYMAIRRPNKPPETGTDVFAIDTGNSSSTVPCWDSGFPVDFAIMSKPSTTYPRQVGTRLLGSKYLSTNATSAEANEPDFDWDSNLGWGKSWNNTMYSWMFKRAPGFMDVVAYSGTVTGNSDSQTVPHNLGVTPELMLVKRRTGSTQWYVYSDALTNPLTQKLVLNDSGDASATSNAWGTSSSPTAPNANNFTVGYATGTGWVTAGDFVAYLFATLPGISKVGSYTGTGSANNIDCGFTAGARFVLIKRTDSSGDWFVFDTARGIVSGNDYFLKLNLTSAQSNVDCIDPYNAGFTMEGTFSGLNASGGTYLFLAIA